MSVLQIDPNPKAGFNYPYYLHIPDGYTGERPILVKPTNSGRPSDEFEDHRKEAEKRMRDESWIRPIADRLHVPLLVPAFPRPFSDPVDWTHSVHQLCARTMRIKEGSLKHVDLQLLAMIDDARERLSTHDQIPPEKVMLSGFSASAAFVNRFTVLHPNRVSSVSAGGVNGIVTLPITTGDIETLAAEQGLDPTDYFCDELLLNYPVGVADIEDLTGDPFDLTSFCEVPQFIYMGEDDDKDVLLWPDPWTDPELRMSAILTYGPDIHEDRFPYCSSVYTKQDVSAIFRTYSATGHDPSPAIDDVITFHEQSIAGTCVEELDDAIGGNPV